MNAYYRPLICRNGPRPDTALDVAGGPYWFCEAEMRLRDGTRKRVSLADVPEDWRHMISAPRADVAGLALDRPRLMGILNVTPDSFSDGGRHDGFDAAICHATAMQQAGADLIDIGGESTRPGAKPVPIEEEIARTAPVIAALTKASIGPISIDTRKMRVAEQAVASGAGLVNDVSGLDHDADMAGYVARTKLPVCVMHSQGDPEVMQDDPRYGDVLLDVYDFLAARIDRLEQLGVPRGRIVVDPGIGFGKTQTHNLTLLNGIALFHGLGCAILLGASRKKFVGTIGGTAEAGARVAGSVAVALAGAAQGVQILRIHDVDETRQALALWSAIEQGEQHGA
ncbi:dihydropteroate synthase [Primorskyibacter marinus]|uniref:dihydropteroate synthase n=1 Tax=Primorskyibacter marinus TaxID=1977320 RepID=UPI000E303720|nr:dihydropteroate synthase [Primorskyibacter marinus]